MGRHCSARGAWELRALKGRPLEFACCVCACVSLSVCAFVGCEGDSACLPVCHSCVCVSVCLREVLGVCENVLGF